MDRAEHQLDRPLSGDALRLERVGKTKTADDDVGARRMTTVELALDILALRQGGALRQQVELGCHQLPMQVGRADLERAHAELARKEAGQGQFQLRIGEEEDAAAGELLAVAGDAGAGALALGRDDLLEARGGDAKSVGGGAHPQRGAFLAERERRGDVARAPCLERAHRIAEEGLGEEETRIGTHHRQLGGSARRKSSDPADAHGTESAQELVLDDVGDRADQQQFGLRTRWCLRQLRHQGGETSVLTLREGGLDAAAGIVEHASAAAMDAIETFCSAVQVELDDLRRTGPDEE